MFSDLFDHRGVRRVGSFIVSVYEPTRFWMDLEPLDLLVTARTGIGATPDRYFNVNDTYLHFTDILEPAYCKNIKDKLTII